MIKVSVMYPNRDGSHFDMSYYCAKHSPLDLDGGFGICIIRDIAHDLGGVGREAFLERVVMCLRAMAL